MSADTSYPPSLFRLPQSHDLDLVGAEVTNTLEVDFTWDSKGKMAHLDFGDGNSVNTDTEAANHTYAANGIYTIRVTCPNASDSAVMDLSAAVPDTEETPEPTEETPESYTAIPVNQSVDETE